MYLKAVCNSLKAPQVYILLSSTSIVHVHTYARGSKEETVFGLEPLFVTIINYSELAWGWGDNGFTFSLLYCIVHTYVCIHCTLHVRSLYLQTFPPIINKISKTFAMFPVVFMCVHSVQCSVCTMILMIHMDMIQKR